MLVKPKKLTKPEDLSSHSILTLKNTSFEFHFRKQEFSVAEVNLNNSEGFLKSEMRTEKKH